MSRFLPFVLLAGLALGATGDAEATKGPRKTPNMPRGWTWPPSAAMKAAGAQCLDDLDAAGVHYTRAKPTRKIATPIVVPDLTFGALELQSIFRKPPFVMDCHLARALTKYSPALADAGVVALRFSTIHNYRTIRKNGRKSKILSRHAIGLAMDVYEVVLADERVLVVKDDYPDPALVAVEKVIAAADEFRTPLTPGTDPKGHDDHFHLEAQMSL